MSRQLSAMDKVGYADKYPTADGGYSQKKPLSNPLRVPP
jgi:hypothetical protein